MADKCQGRKYRSWSKTEDDKLVEALVNMVNSGGFKADNGFKSGYLQHLEQALKISLPDSNLLAKPHIESRIKTMKKDWQIVHDLMHGNTSGFGFDSSIMCVTAEDQVWEEYLKAHKEAAKWRNKPFPHYEDMSFVFGKDRAHGNQAKDYDGLDENANMEDIQLPTEQEQQSDENIEYSTENSQMPSEDCTSQATRKRKSRGDPLVDAITNAAHVLSDKLQKVSDTLVQIELDIHQKTSMVSSELAKMDSFTAFEKFQALRKITRESESVLSFWNLEGEAREEFVRFMLAE